MKGDTRNACMDVKWLFAYLNSEIFASILFSRIALKDMFAMSKDHDYGMIYLHQETTVILQFREGFIVTKLREIALI